MSRFIKSTYEYNKIRKDFGRQLLFSAGPAVMLDSISSDRGLQKQYILRNPVHRHVQAALPQSQHEANTKLVVVHEQGINHSEGGWPREIHPEHEEMRHRHCRRFMHDETYIRSVTTLAPKLTHCIYQNNAIEMYQTYFTEMKSQDPVEKHELRISNTFRDPYERPVACVEWTHEKASKLAVSYHEKGLKSNSPIYEFYVWDLNNQTSPLYTLHPECTCWQLACSPVDPEVILCGLKNGTVSIFDIREGYTAVSSSSVYNSHRDVVTGLQFIHSRTNTEFYTGSPDGECLWWDTRNLSEPTTRLAMSVRITPSTVPRISNAEGISSIEFDRNLPTKFLCGTESGLVIGGNRLGKTHSEILYAHWYAHDGPVRAIHRSPCTPRMFITCGDFTVRIWSEEIRTDCIIASNPYRREVVDVQWAPQRISSYMSASVDGKFYYWDLLRRYRDPVISLQVSNDPLTKVTPHTEGELVATGDSKGQLYLLHLSESMAMSGARDKQLMFQIYERETRREHVLDNRLKEINLKKRAEEEAAAAAEAEESEEGAIDRDVEVEEADDRAVEEEYFRIVKEQMHLMGIETPSEVSFS